MGESKRALPRRKLLLVSICLLLIGTGVVFAIVFKSPSIRLLLKPDFRHEVLRFSAILFATEKYYVDEEQVDFHQLTNEALIGMAESLDRHSKFIPAESFQRHAEQEQLGYAGTGFRAWEFDGKHLVARVFPGTPAQKAGLKVGDQVVKIDGESSSQWNDDEFTSRMQGEPGTHVSIDVMGASGERVLSMQRAKIRPKAVDDFWVNSQGLGYLRITKFTKYVGAEMENRLPKMMRHGMQGLVLDLRGNPGGEMDSARDVASFFLPQDSLFASLKSRTQEMEREYRTIKKKVSVEIPLVILINEQSASGAECLAGALRHYGRALLVGKTTFGKGTAQNLIRLSEGSALHLTMAHYHLPDGSNPEKQGITPDHEVGVPEEMERQLRFQRDIAGELDPTRFSSLFGFEPIPDPQLEMAMTLLSEAVASH